MTPTRSYRRSTSTLLPACVLALLGLGLLAPSTAGAAHCGRYVLADARFERDLARLLQGDGFGLSAEAARLPALPIEPPTPCKGASCSVPPASPTSPVAPATLAGEHWACQFAPFAASPALSRFIDADEDDRMPIRDGLAVFHPPRRIPSA